MMSDEGKDLVGWRKTRRDPVMMVDLPFFFFFLHDTRPSTSIVTIIETITFTFQAFCL
jgi:hypothetical protein